MLKMHQCAMFQSMICLVENKYLIGRIFEDQILDEQHLDENLVKMLF